MAIQYYLTDAGRDVALNAASLGLNVSLSHIAVGSGKYDPLTALGNISLVAELARFPLNGGGIEPNSHTLRFVSSIEPNITADGFEIGIFTDTGVLFAIASTTTNTPLIRLVENIVTISTFGMILSTIDLANLIITIDPNTPICVALMNQHLDHPNPHPQYAFRTDLQTEKDARIFSDNLLNEKIDTEITARAEGDEALSERVTDLENTVVPQLVISGTILMWAVSIVPAGYLECAGQAVSRETYAALFAVIGTNFGNGNGSTTFNLPDMRGEFVRGWDHGRGIDSGRGLGEFQQATSVFMGDPNAGFTSVANLFNKLNDDETVMRNALNGEMPSLDATNLKVVSSGAENHNDPTTVFQTTMTVRPRNISLMYIIKT